MTFDAGHPFDPALTPCFSDATWRSAEAYQRNGREMFHALMHSGEDHGIYPAAYEFVRQRLAAQSALLSDASAPCPFSTDPGPIPPFSLPTALVSGPPGHYWLQLAPIILIEPCWLQGVSQAVTSEETFAVKVMAIYLQWVNRYRNSFAALLQASGIEFPDLPTRVFATREDINDAVFDFAALQLSLSCFPRVFFPEILGFTLACARSRWLSPSFDANYPQALSSNFANLRQRCLAAAEPQITELVGKYLDYFSDQLDPIRQRIQSGYRLYQKEAELCCDSLLRQYENPPSAARQWAELLARKAPAAFGHHRKIVMSGRILDDWFGESPFDADGFLSALTQSRYLDRKHPGDSILLKLFDFGGPMFGVLSSDEREVLEKWLESGPAALTEVPFIGCAAPADSSVMFHAEKVPSPSVAYSKLNSRTLYYYLVNADLYPDVLPAAKNRVRHVLRSPLRFQRLPLKPYRHRDFEQYIDDLYRSEVDRYEPLESTPRLNRETYCWGIEQFAPAILVDGCWLQHVGRLAFGPHRAIGAILFKIYEDECGNGQQERNHPFIYRKLTESIGLELPATGSREFIRHSGFLDSAFDLPVYLLSISQFPASFLPELLGLNMAIELSGLGNGYLRLSEELSHWGIDPAIVDIHTSIDNVSSGHAFLAKQAIQIYLDEIAVGFGDDAVQSHWQRIHDGYCSLQSVCRGFKLALICRYMINRIRHRNCNHCHNH